MIQLDKCPSTLDLNHETFSPKALRHLFSGKKVSHVLKFSKIEGLQSNLVDNRTKISISGVQEKYSLKLDKNKLVLTKSHGTYILKLISNGLHNAEFLPANEHLTMQLASQVYKLDVAKNGLVFFEDGTPAYITKRFDVREDGTKALKEDFASLLQRNNRQGEHFKYAGSYYDMALAIDQYIGANIQVKENLFKLIIFNYLFSNGDAHLKNFSVIDYLQDGLYQLAPAYDLVCTRLHIDDGDFALDDNLYENDFDHPSYATYGFHAYDDFYDFGLKIGLKEVRIRRFLDLFLSKTDDVKAMVAKSFLSEVLQDKYVALYTDKLRRLQLSLSGRI